MQVGILGPLIVTDDDGRPIEVGGSRLRALLIRLAADAGGWISVGELVTALWENDPPRDEMNALQSLVSRLRRALPVPELIESGPAGYRLAIAPEAVDGLRFERLAVQARRRLTTRQPEEASAQLSEALGLWRGTALSEVADVQYAMTWAQQLEKLRLTAIDDRAAAGLQLNRHPELIADLEEVIERHPLRERTHELLIRALAGTGRQAEALAVYERLSRRLADELGLDPPVQLQRLQTAVLRNDPKIMMAADRTATAGPGLGQAPGQGAGPGPGQGFGQGPDSGSRPGRGSGPEQGPGPTTAQPQRPRRTNLRSPLTSFIGRDDEVAQLERLLNLGSRLITLIGTGGAGKTRLVSEVASKIPALGPDGVWMVELAPVTDPEDVASTVLGSIGSLDLQILERQPATNRDALTRLVKSLADHDVVLILDNCEHVLDAAAKLAELLLGQCPRLKILATSREPFGIVGESLCPVQPLNAPGPASTGQAALATPAVQLFVDRAALVRPGFAVTAETAGPVAEICRRLDGLPLAIELAAARLRNLTLEAIAARLSDRFRLLTGGNRTAMPRHQTLRAVVAWSWELMTESERLLAERLSVFPGGATAETAQAVCTSDAPDAEGLAEDIVADLLTSLADKSLLVLVEPIHGDDGTYPRYRMLETIREFAAEQLHERGETAARRSAHARYFLAMAETAEPKLRTAEQLFWLERLTAERDNLLAALRFAAETSDADTAVRLAASLCWYWNLLGRHDEAANWLDQALKVPGERPAQPYAIVMVVHTLSAAASGLGIPDSDQIEHLVSLVRGIDLEQMHPILALVEPGIAMIGDDSPLVNEALERNLAHPDPWARAMLNLMATVQAENDGDVETVEERLPQALAEFRKIGDRWGIGTASGIVANLYSIQGRVEEAIASLQEARQLMIELHASDDEAYALARVGMLRLRLGDLAGARRDVEAALELAERTGSAMSDAFSRNNLAMLTHYEGRTDEARRLGLEALAAVSGASFSPPQVRASVQCGLATFDLATGNLDDARQRLVEAYAGVKSSSDMPVAAVLATGVAELLLATGRPAQAAEALGAGIRLRGSDDLSDPDVRRVADLTRTALGPTDFARHHEAGRTLSREAASDLLRTSLGIPAEPAQPK